MGAGQGRSSKGPYCGGCSLWWRHRVGKMWGKGAGVEMLPSCRQAGRRWVLQKGGGQAGQEGVWWGAYGHKGGRAGTYLAVVGEAGVVWGQGLQGQQGALDHSWMGRARRDVGRAHNTHGWACAGLDCLSWIH